MTTPESRERAGEFMLAHGFLGVTEANGIFQDELAALLDEVREEARENPEVLVTYSALDEAVDVERERWVQAVRKVRPEGKPDEEKDRNYLWHDRGARWACDEILRELGVSDGEGK